METLPEQSAMRPALAGFLVSGFLFALPGALLPLWEYQLSEEYRTAGSYFLSLVAGMAVAAWVARNAFPRRSIGAVLTLGCGLACASLAGLALAPVTGNVPWRAAGFFLIGISAGLVNTGLLHALAPAFERHPARTVNAAGIFFGAGCLASALVAAGTFSHYSVDTILFALALVPLVFTGLYWRTVFPAPDTAGQPTVREALRESRTGRAVLLALLLFFQFGNEWSIAGWLPLYLANRLGESPAAALWLLALYWTALVAGRVLVLRWIERLGTFRLLFGSAAAALFGCFTLVMTNNRFGAVMGILLVGGGFASIYPLMAARIALRFPHYHPGFFNGIFSVALVGGMLAPGMLGVLASAYGLQMVMLLPAVGTCMVVALLMVLWTVGKVRG